MDVWMSRRKVVLLAQNLLFLLVTSAIFIPVINHWFVNTHEVDATSKLDELIFVIEFHNHFPTLLKAGAENCGCSHSWRIDKWTCSSRRNKKKETKIAGRWRTREKNKSHKKHRCGRGQKKDRWGIEVLLMLRLFCCFTLDFLSLLLKSKLKLNSTQLKLKFKTQRSPFTLSDILPRPCHQHCHKTFHKYCHKYCYKCCHKCCYKYPRQTLPQKQKYILQYLHFWKCYWLISILYNKLNLPMNTWQVPFMLCFWNNKSYNFYPSSLLWGIHICVSASTRMIWVWIFSGFSSDQSFCTCLKICID